jgi:hypothetical protein
LNIATLQCRNEGEEYCAFSAPLLRQNAPDPAAACAAVQNERRRGILGPGVGSVGMGRAVQMGDVPKTGQVRRHGSWLQASLPQNSPACWRPLFPVTGFGQHDCLDVGVFKNTSLAAVLIGSISPASERCSGWPFTKRRRERPPVNPAECDGIGRPCRKGRGRQRGIEKAFAGFGRLAKIAEISSV